MTTASIQKKSIFSKVSSSPTFASILIRLIDDKVNEEEVEQSFNIKTLKIGWEGNKNSFMHVFIDTTDILKLEEAKNNIRCQKIMFASASHEFRTPLNAIVNSLSFINDYDQAIKRELGAYAMFTSEKAESSVMEKFTKLEKFIKMGSNSSILLLSLIEDILSMAKFESGNFKVNKTVFSLDSLISEIDDIFSCQ